MAGPICTAIEDQFDAWNTRIDELKTMTKEAAKEQAEKIEKDINDYVEKKGKELSKQDEKTKSKAQNANAIKEVSAPTKIDDALDAINKTLTLVKDIAKEITDMATDIAAAPNLLTTKSQETLKKLTELP